MFSLICALEFSEKHQIIYSYPHICYESRRETRVKGETSGREAAEGREGAVTEVHDTLGRNGLYEINTTHSKKPSFSSPSPSSGSQG